MKLENGQLDSVATVKDDGIGISPAFLPHIFEPFTQENRTGYEAGNAQGVLDGDIDEFIKAYLMEFGGKE